VDSEENMAKLVLLYVMLSIYVADIIYLWRLQKSLKFAILECKKSKICDFLHLTVRTLENQNFYVYCFSAAVESFRNDVLAMLRNNEGATFV